MTPEIYQLLKNTDWDVVGKQLLAFTIWRVQNYRWGTYSRWELPQGKTPEDIVQQVIEKTLSGKRHWDPQEGPLLPWLKDQVKSIVDALFQSAAHRHEVQIPEDEDTHESLDSIPPQQQTTENFATPILDPEINLMEKEEAEWTAKNVNALFAALSGEPELQQVLTAMLDGCEPKPRFLAKELGVSVSEINNRLKRLRRHAMKLEMEFSHAK